MTIEELYELRQQLLDNKVKFSELNAKYNELLSKRNIKKSKEKKMTERDFIKGKSFVWYWARFFILLIATLIFKIPEDISLMCLIGNLGIKIFDEKVILPKLWDKMQRNGVPESKEEIDQRELYEEVADARKLYHDLNKKYEREFNKLSVDDRLAYFEFLKGLRISLDLEVKEEKEKENPGVSSGDVKLLNMVYEEQ